MIMATSRPSQSDVVTEIMLGIFRVNARLLEKGNQLVAPLGMTSARWQILGAIALSGQAASCPQVAAAMGVSRQGAQKQLNLALEDGLIAAHDNPRNVRSPLYDLTAVGRRTYAAAMALETPWARALARGVAPADWLTTLNVLRELDARLQSTPLPNEE
jgi:DNA-binding MarR family transcriptional regulator